jgi:hypothetical protein
LLVRCEGLEWRVVSRVFAKDQEHEQTGRAVTGLSGGRVNAYLVVCGEGLGYQWQKRNK